jgi:DNA-binding NtrC family response regulator
VSLNRDNWSVDESEASTPPNIPTIEPSGVTSISLDERLREVERTLIGWALKVSGGNKSRAAALLQIKRSTLGDRINRCGLGRPPLERAS